MPFLRADFNGRHHATGIKGWTRHIDARKFAPASLICFEGGDFAWRGERFLAWGEQVVLGTWHSFDLPWNHQHGLPHCDIVSRREYTSSGGWKEAA